LRDDDFPEIRDNLTRKGIRYFIYRYLRKREHNQYMPIDRVEDLCSGSKQMLCVLVEELTYKGKTGEAKNIMVRNKLDFTVALKV